MPVPRRARARVQLSPAAPARGGGRLLGTAWTDAESAAASNLGGRRAARPCPPRRAGRRSRRRLSLPDFSASIRRIGPRLRERMSVHHRAGCPVPSPGLRLPPGAVRRLRWLRAHRGRWWCTPRRRGGGAGVPSPVRRALARRQDEAGPTATRATTTGPWPRTTPPASGRPVAGTDRWSEHSYGRAIDLNPVQNPYVVAPRWHRGGSESRPRGSIVRRRVPAPGRDPGRRRGRQVLRADRLGVGRHLAAPRTTSTSRIRPLTGTGHSLGPGWVTRPRSG